MAVDNKGMQDWVADYNGEWMMVVSGAGDSGVAMMAAMVENGGGRQQRRWWTTRVADDDGGGWRLLAIRAADYDREGQEQMVREGGDSGVVMMAAVKMAAAKDSGGR